MSEPLPQRIGDAERDRAAECLREHLAHGRLTQVEFDDRITAALSARTADELTPLFADLPAPRPDGGPAAPALSQTSWPAYQPPAGAVAPPSPTGSELADAAAGKRLANGLAIASAVMWPLYVMVCFAIGWEYWWLCFIPIMLSSVAGERQKHARQRSGPQPEVES